MPRASLSDVRFVLMVIGAFLLGLFGTLASAGAFLHRG